MDWDAIYVSSLPAWRTDEPDAPGIYRVLITTCDYLTGTPLQSAERFARWNGVYWCCWGPTLAGATLAYFRGPNAGYPWRHLEAADTVPECNAW